ncbi:hypothetical protein [Methylobacterium soli]|uniref:Uncharacterized protein n=1 Tax=Methylobacterium soli TaxID=553447 RepID=A0A6L3SV81_9HYPH|nr:hypothetical protein [Methylobacterium soli]KAB1069502.1 hypothetical protein F6X53_30980 [Methylobacterium soli]GJE46917.1 hypothetical protein AEGHOMDF_6126 [Methylobacterium soli]
MLQSDALPSLATDDLTGDLQYALAALADVEFAFQSACERLNDLSGPQARKEQVRQQLEAERDRRRTPLIRRLDELDRRMKAFVFSQPSSEWQASGGLERPMPASKVHA